jgi:hypothetical protein
LTDTDRVAGVLPLVGETCSQLALVGVVTENEADPLDEIWKLCAGGAVVPTV